MSKYIVELKPEYEDSFKGVMILGAKDNDLFVDALAIDDLELLNSDYINEHFGDLQDEAYQRGLDDAWEAAKKIFGYEIDGGIPINELRKVFGYAEDAIFCTADVIRHNSASEAVAKLKAYEEKQKAEDDIKLGDVLEHTVSGYTSKAIFLEKIEDDEDWYKCLFWTGCGLAILSYPKSQFKRIGKHFDIDKILEEMRHG